MARVNKHETFENRYKKTLITYLYIYILYFPCVFLARCAIIINFTRSFTARLNSRRVITELLQLKPTTSASVFSQIRRLIFSK